MFTEVYSSNSLKYNRVLEKTSNLESKMRPPMKKEAKVSQELSLKRLMRTLSRTESKLQLDSSNSFFYEAGEFTAELVSHLTWSLTKLLFNQGITVEDEKKLSLFVKKDTGKRMFVFLLNSIIASVDQISLKESSFEIVLHLFNIILSSLESHYVNFLTTEILLKAAKIIFRKTKNKKEYLQFFIREQPSLQ